MDDRKFLGLIDLFKSRLVSAMPVDMRTNRVLIDGNITKMSSEILDTANQIDAFEKILRTEFGPAVSINFWNPVFSMFFYWQSIQKMELLCRSFGVEDREKVIQLCDELKNSTLSRIVESIVSSVGDQALDRLASSLDHLFDLRALTTRAAMVARIETAINRMLTASERSRLEPILLELGGKYRRQLS